MFAEHRYEGESFPGVVGMPNCLSHCTSAEALADYASLVTAVKDDDFNATTSPTIAFGGSYGGMLSAWLRMKYPNIVDGWTAPSRRARQSGPSLPASHRWTALAGRSLVEELDIGRPRRAPPLLTAFNPLLAPGRVLRGHRPCPITRGVSAAGRAAPRTPAVTT